MKNLIRDARILKGYSQENMADMLHLSQGQYSKMESSGSGLNLERIRNISRILEVDITQLLPFTQDNFPGVDDLIKRIYKLERENHFLDLQVHAALHEAGHLKDLVSHIFEALGEPDYKGFKKKFLGYYVEYTKNAKSRSTKGSR